MTVETAITIEQLNPLLPDDTGTPNEGALFEDPAHTRLIKDVLKRIFPGVGGNGFNRAILAFEDELNQCVGLTSALQGQLTALSKTSVPIGGVIIYSGLFSNIPANYALCTGAGGTPNLENKFAYGTNTEGQQEITGGSDDSIVVAHTHNADHNHPITPTSSDGAHSHDVDYVQFFDGTNPLDRLSSQRVINSPVTSSPTDLEAAHNHTLTIDSEFLNTSTTGESGTAKNIPPFYYLAYIQRLS